MSVIGSVKSKAAFFDKWVKDNMKVDPETVRLQLRAKPQNGKLPEPPPPRDELKPNPYVETTGAGFDDEAGDTSGYQVDQVPGGRPSFGYGEPPKVDPYKTVAFKEDHDEDDSDDSDDEDDDKSGYQVDEVPGVKPPHGHGESPKSNYNTASFKSNLEEDDDIDFSDDESDSKDDDSESKDDDSESGSGLRSEDVSFGYGGSPGSDPYAGSGDVMFTPEGEPDKVVDEGTGLVGLPLGAKYRGEENAEGWQKGRTRDGKQVVTDYFDETRKEESRIDFTTDGEAMDDTAEDLDGERGFVVDPKTGDIHQFKEKVTEKDGNVVFTHHSSPLAGGDVAGAGKIEFDEGRIVSINDQSGHYKPRGEFTFQAVRQINLANMTDEIKAKLRKRNSTMTGEGGTAESPDTMEQLIAAEIQVRREAYFKSLDEEEAEMNKAASELPEGEQDEAFEEIAQKRHAAAKAFRDIARQIEKNLLDLADQGEDTDEDDRVQTPLIDGSEDTSGRKNKKLSPQLKKLIAALKTVKSLIREKKLVGEDVSSLDAKLEKIEALLQKEGVDVTKNKEARVALLGKTGMLSDDEYKPLLDECMRVLNDSSSTKEQKEQAVGKFRNDFNMASALKQLAAPLGEEKFAQLLKQKPTGEESAIQVEMRARNITPGEKGAVEKLKAALGAEAVAALKGDAKQIEELSRKFGVVASDSEKFAWGPEASGFEIGEKSAVNLTAQQFLQTGGNEAQIRAKKRLTDEIRSSKPELKDVDSPAKKKEENLQPEMDDPKRQEMLAETLEDDMNERDEALGDLLKEIEEDPAVKKKGIQERLEEIGHSIESQEMQMQYFGGDPEESYKLRYEEAKTLHAELNQERKKMEELLDTL